MGNLTHRERPTGLALRLVAAVLGGYAFSASIVAALGGILALVGLARSEAVAMAAMLGFVIYLLVLLWAFSERSPLRLWRALAVGFCACGAMVWLLPAGT